MSFADLQRLFSTHPDDRDLVVNILDLSISHDLELIRGIMLPEFLNVDLVKFTKSSPKNAMELRKGIKSSAETLWMLISQFSSLSGVHMDHKGRLTWICITTGMKLWFLIEPSSHNLENRKRCGEFKGLSSYARIHAVLLGPGDLLIMPPGTLHAVYTPCDAKAIGGEFLHPKFLPDSLRKASISLRHSHLTNDPIPRKVVQQEFSNIIEVNFPSSLLKLLD
jgi:hypothetical protein